LATNHPELRETEAKRLNECFGLLSPIENGKATVRKADYSLKWIAAAKFKK